MKRFVLVCSIVLLGFALASCRDMRGRDIGTVTGAAAGSAIGVAAGGHVVGAVGGAVIGGVIGHQVGKGMEKKK